MRRSKNRKQNIPRMQVKKVTEIFHRDETPNLVEHQDIVSMKNETGKLDYGFIGDGSKDFEIVETIIKGEKQFKYTVYGWPAGKLLQLKKLGAKIAKSPNDVIKNSDIIFVSLLEDISVEKTIFASKAILKIEKGKGIVNMSFLTDWMATALQKSVTDLSGRYLELQIQSESDDGVAIVCGDDKLLEMAEPIIKIFSKVVLFLGPNPGMAVEQQAAMNIQKALDIFSAAEKLVFYEKNGMKLHDAIDFMTGSEFKIEAAIAIISNSPNTQQISVQNLLCEMKIAYKMIPISTLSITIIHHLEKALQLKNHTDCAAIALFHLLR